MTEKPIRILHYIKHLESGGGETLVYNIYKTIDRETIQFDFLVNTERKELLDDKVAALGGRRLVLMKREPKCTPLKIVLAMTNLYKLLRKGEYKIFHIHCSNGQGLLYAYIAKRAGVPVCVVHIHNAGVDGRFKIVKRAFHCLCKVLFMKAPDYYIACSEAAARWLYSDRIVEDKRYLLLKNGIEADRFRYNEGVRYKIRERLHINDKKVLLNVGRMQQQKNQKFIIDIYAELSRTGDNYSLIIIGRGALEKQLKDYARKKGIYERIHFIDYTDRVEDYMCAADIFLLPSFEEGLGIAAIEAQASGLHTLVSEAVPREAYISPLVRALPADKGCREWTTAITKLGECTNREEAVHYIDEAGYGIEKCAAQISELYLRSISKEHFT